MAVTVPTLPQLVERTRATFRSHLGSNVQFSRFSLLNALVLVIATHVKFLLETLVRVEITNRPETASGEPLDGWATSWDVPRLSSAEAELSVRITVETNHSFTGSVPLVFSFGDERFQYVGNLARGANTVSVISQKVGETVVEVGNTLSSTVGTAEVLSVTQGQQEESDESLRPRFRGVFGARGGGGRTADWIAWAKEASGVTRVFVRNSGAGRVTVYPIADINNDITFSGFVEDVRRVLEPRRPVATELIVTSPDVTPINIQVSGVEETDRAEAIRLLTQAFVQHGELGQPFSPNHLTNALAALPAPNQPVLQRPTQPVTIPEGAIPTFGTLDIR